MKKTLLAITIAAGMVAALAGCAPTSTSSDCIEVVVDFGILGDSPAPNCVEVATDSINAKELLLSAGYETEGTVAYGDQIVCRVNKLPSPTESFQVEGEDPHTETCAEMPPAFAYWALWIKKSKTDAWEYAQEGIGSLELEPGQAIGLVFSVAGETNTPN